MMKYLPRVFLASLVQLVEMVCLDLEVFPVFLVLRVTLERMVSREKSGRLVLKVSREARVTSDLLEALVPEVSEGKLVPLVLLETKDHQD